MQFAVQLIFANESKSVLANCARVSEHIWVLEGDITSVCNDAYVIAEGVTEGGHGGMNTLQMLADVKDSFPITFKEIKEALIKEGLSDDIIDAAADIERCGWEIVFDDAV